MKKLYSHFAVVLCLFFSVSVVSAKENWTITKSKNFTLVGNAGEKDIRKIAVRLEQFRESLKLLLPRADLNRPLPTTVFVFDSDADFKPFKPRRNGKVQDLIAGYFLQGQDTVYIALTAETRSINSFEVIFHEFQHFVLDNNFDDPPLWLNEGLAEVYSTFQINDEANKISIGLPIARHIQTLRERSLIPLKTLFAVRHNSKEYNERSKVGIFYAESWVFVHYLLYGNEGKRRQQFTSFLGNLNSGLSTEENFRQSFQTDFDGMEKELRLYTDKFLFPYVQHILKKELDFDKEMQTRQLSEAEAEFEQGKLLFHLGQPDEAEKRWQKAISLSPNFAPAQAWLGFLRTRQRQFDDAETLLAKAADLAPNDYLPRIFQSDLFASVGKRDEAVRAAEKAVELQPNSARNLVALAAVDVFAGKDAEAFAAYVKALRLAPREAGYFLASSHVALRLRRGLPASLQAQSYLRMRGWDEQSSPYAALNAYFGYRIERDKTKADKILEMAAQRIDSSAWAFQIVRFLRREISAEDLLKLADNNDKQTEARAYIGLDLALNDKTDEAVPYYNWVKENGNRNFTEYALVLAELKRIEASTAKN